MRIVIELKRGEVGEVILNNLYKQTQLQDTFGMNMVALVDGQPRLLNLKQMLECFLSHRREVVTRRTVYELRKARERGHILEGLAVALSNVDEIIALIKAAPTPPDAKRSLMGRQWRSPVVEEMLVRPRPTPHVRMVWRLNSVCPTRAIAVRCPGTGHSRTASAAPDRSGAGQDRQRIQGRDGQDSRLLDILARPERITEIIVGELTAIRDQFGDERRSEIVLHTQELGIEDFITPQDMVVTLSHGGYVKAQPLADYRAQKRGGRGKQAAAIKDEDFVDHLFVANTHDFILCFSNRGRCYWLKVYEAPQGSRTSRGKPIVNLFPLEEGERINAVLPVKEFVEDKFIFMATRAGTVKKTPLSDFSNPRKAGIIAVDLLDDDILIGVELTTGQSDIVLVSNAGKAVWFDEEDVRPMGASRCDLQGSNLEMVLGFCGRVPSGLARCRNRGESAFSVIQVRWRPGAIESRRANGFALPIVQYRRMPPDASPCNK
jgi:DNA gyrase subunit A